MQKFLSSCVLLSGVLLAAPALAVPTAESSGSALSVDLSLLQALDATIGPIAPASGMAMDPGESSYDDSSQVLDLDVRAQLVGIPGLGTAVRASADVLGSQASGSITGAPQATGSTSVSDLSLGIVSEALFLNTVLVELGSGTITSESTASADGGLSATGSSIIEGLELSTLLIGDIEIDLGLLAAAAPNTQLVDLLGLEVIFNEQTMLGDGVNSIGIATNALRISFDDFLLGGSLLSGDILIGSSRAFVELGDDGGPVPVPEPALLGLFGLGLAGLGLARFRRR